MAGQVRESTATIRWLTHPPAGRPRLTVGSHTFPALTLAVGDSSPHPLATSPGELMAGAIGSVFAWLLADELMRTGTRAHELVVYVGLRAEGEASDPQAGLRALHLHLEGRVPGLDADGLQDMCERTLVRCRRAMGLRDDIEADVDSTSEAR